MEWMDLGDPLEEVEGAEMAVDYEEEGELLEDGAEQGRYAVNIKFGELMDQCINPTLLDAFGQVGWIFVACLVFRYITRKVLERYDRDLRYVHLLSFMMGGLALFSVVGEEIGWTLYLSFLGFWCLWYCNGFGGIRRAQTMTMVLLSYLVGREYFGRGPEGMDRVRGVEMIMVMKILSICYDIGMKVKPHKVMPSIAEYLGYLFCPANVIFGPWIPFDAYMDMCAHRFVQNRWILGICVIFCVICSFGSLGVSACVIYWVFLGTESRLLLTYRDAMSVRFSHYFISYLSELGGLLIGFNGGGGVSVESVVEPIEIEMPRSLVQVVARWNKPMHLWLRTYIFRPSLERGTFHAVLWTFAVSAMLHGLNFGLTLVLLSLGFYTYAEHALRNKLAAIFNACIRSRDCPIFRCRHVYRSDHPAVIAVNFGFGLLAVFNLAYLGIMISKTFTEGDPGPSSIFESFSNDIQKWSELYFFSHYLMFFVYIFATLI